MISILRPVLIGGVFSFVSLAAHAAEFPRGSVQGGAIGDQGVLVGLFAVGILATAAVTGGLTFWLTRRRLGGGASQAKLDAVSRSQAVIEFDLDGTIRHANDNFLKAMGYALEEIVGQHHGMFVDPTHRGGAEYQAFWERLRRGEFFSEEFKRIAKGGREVWIQASYNPIIGADGRPTGVIKFAADVTAAKLRAADMAGQMEAISKSQAVIEFDTNGVIQHANENFLNALGYTLDEIRGKHHGMFVDDAYRASGDYRAFWDQLRRGEYVAGEFKRFAKGGREIWIQASYNPIYDLNGKPFKVVKYASDITTTKLAAVDAAGQIDAISKSQAVIEFDLDGTIRTANDNFLKALGYGLNEIQGQHHGMFVEDSYRSSGAYRDFWAKLARGQFHAGRFKRIAKDGGEIWIQASYNPIFDMNGKPCKVVKYATDVTAQVRLEHDMQELVKFISDAVIQVSDASTQVSSAAQTLAEGASTQAASLEETSASLEEITAMVKANADNARLANELSTMASTSASDGSKIMDKMQVTMNGITEASEKISNIIKVIEEIAFQTNLLALNAAVEAARAGEHGKGFAVVAEEVRNLAQRSAEAAKETTQLISNSVSRAGEGTRVSNEASQALSAIVEHVTKMAGLIEQISAASDDQARGVEQINTAVSEMDKVTQQNAATAEESASASEELNSQALSLREACERFQARNQTVSTEKDVVAARALQASTF